MNFASILALAVGLSMDATAVAAAKGLSAAELKARHVALVALLFGGFQAGMPLLGWGLGAWVGPWMDAWSHWVAFALLGAIGGKMIHESRQADDQEGKEGGDPFALKPMLLLAVATSIDAFAVGVTLPMLRAPMAVSLATIGLTTALLSALGLAAGRRFGAMLGRRLDMGGGVLLVALGAKILLERLLRG